MKPYNEKLMTWRNTQPAELAGLNNIQIPGNSELLIWQNRYKEPTTYEQDLVNNLLKAFSNGITEVLEIVNFFNSQGFYQESGLAWDEKNFQEEMQKLGY